jgi:hypothetical protein
MLVAFKPAASNVIYLLLQSCELLYVALWNRPNDVQSAIFVQMRLSRIAFCSFRFALALLASFLLRHSLSTAIAAISVEIVKEHKEW